MSSSRPLVALLILLAPLSSMGCKKLLDAAKGGDDAGVDSAPPAASASATADVDAAPAPSVAASETPADAIFTPPGPCVDVRRDADKRNGGGGRATEIALDLDGDAKPDKVVQFGIGGDDRASPMFLYVMSGTCGVFVGTLTASSVKLSGGRSRGLKSVDALSIDASCTDSCTCKDKSMVFFFNGKTYQASGKPRDVARKCVDGGSTTRKLVLPKCASGQSLFAETEDDPPFCSRPCSADAECKPAKCDQQAFMVDDKTGSVFTGVGKSVPVCGKGASATPPPAAAATVLAVPAGAPAIIPNPTLLDCPDGYVKLIGTKSCNKSCRSGACPSGTKCTPPMSVCM